MKKHGMKSLISCLLLASLCLALGAQEREYLMVNEVWAPYRIGEQENCEEWTGIDIDLAKEIGRRLGIVIRIQNAPWARCLEMIRSGHADILTGVAWTSIRATQMVYVPTWYCEVYPVFYARTTMAADVTSYDDLYGKKIGLTAGSAYFEPFNSDKKLDKLAVKDEQTLLKMLAIGRVDLAVGTEPNIGWDTMQFGLKGSIGPVAWKPDVATHLFVVVSRQAAAEKLDLKIDACLKEIVADGTMQAILDKYR